jgi:hypothetical protein
MYLAMRPGEKIRVANEPKKSVGMIRDFAHPNRKSHAKKRKA